MRSTAARREHRCALTDEGKTRTPRRVRLPLASMHVEQDASEQHLQQLAAWSWPLLQVACGKLSSAACLKDKVTRDV